MKEIPIMPDEYKGNFRKKNKYNDDVAREWTNDEIKWCLNLKEKGFTIKEIAQSIDRGTTSVSIKMKRLSKKNDNYNTNHIDEKYEINKLFFDIIKPKTILDVYCGTKSYWKNNTNVAVTTNDKDDSIEADFHLDALKFLCLLYADGKKYDLIDLDPFGTSYECFDLAIKMANKGIIITLGEMGHKRFKRFDFVRNAYGINNIDNFNSLNMIKEIKRIGLINKKKLTIEFIKDWNGISRVWLSIEKYKSTEQWNNKFED